MSETNVRVIKDELEDEMIPEHSNKNSIAQNSRQCDEFTPCFLDSNRNVTTKPVEKQLLDPQLSGFRARDIKRRKDYEVRQNKKQRLNDQSKAIDISNDEADDVKWTPVYGRSVFSPESSDKVHETIDSVIESRIHGAVPPENWASDISSLLKRSIEKEIEEKLDKVFTSVGKYLAMTKSYAQSRMKSRSTRTILDMLLFLPSSSDIMGWVHQRERDKGNLYSLEQTVDNALNEVNTKGLSERSYALSSRKLVDNIMRLSSLYLKQLKCFANASTEITQHEYLVDNRWLMIAEDFSSTQDGIMNKMGDCLKRLENAREYQDKAIKGLNELILQKENELISIRESVLSAHFNAHSTILASEDADVLELLQKQHSCSKVVQQNIRALEKMKQKQQYTTHLQEFLGIVRQHRVSFQKPQIAALDEAKVTASANIAIKLKFYIPYMMRFIAKLHEIHHTRQTRAKMELEDLKKKLDLHIEYFGASAPIKKKDLQRRIQEFILVHDRSVQDELDLAGRQYKLWNQNCYSLASDTVQLIVIAFEELANKLERPIKMIYLNLASKLESTYTPERRDCVQRFMVSSDYKCMPTELQITNRKFTSDRFQVGKRVYAKVNLDGKKSKFFRGRITKKLEEGLVSMLFDEGDVYTLSPEHLCTPSEVEREAISSDDETDENSSMSDPDVTREKSCCVM
uniref:Uncharacterized protein AlNc14C111G6390 n=1 Tax=Albugo laibachii Nc14 TaxID=890382 RepID=F0WIJ0_9STRA|nr:conserved hypothetical protein [Albugo laibachii Nc14]|eukprot:CCA21072.1 conserved hypothetical protein [Albugo laibachii Nc14]